MQIACWEIRDAWENLVELCQEALNWPRSEKLKDEFKLFQNESLGPVDQLQRKMVLMWH